jgi:hypothetical protein
MSGARGLLSRPGALLLEAPALMRQRLGQLLAKLEALLRPLSCCDHGRRCCSRFACNAPALVDICAACIDIGAL